MAGPSAEETGVLRGKKRLPGPERWSSKAKKKRLNPGANIKEIRGRREGIREKQREGFRPVDQQSPDVRRTIKNRPAKHARQKRAVAQVSYKGDCPKERRATEVDRSGEPRKEGVVPTLPR